MSPALCSAGERSHVDWRDEVATALDEWIALAGGAAHNARWRRVGAARATGEPGVFVVDIRGSELSADQLNELRLADADEGSLRSGFTVMEATVEGPLLRVRVAEFANPDDPHVWILRQPPTFLLTALRDGIAGLTDGGLANLLARGEIGGRPGQVPAPPGLLPPQAEAYRACFGRGVWLVWGPPGTGKTRMLRAAIADLIKEGRRVLLASSTNIAVDNALLGVLREYRPRPGRIVRVGPPQLREVARDPNVSLPLIVRSRLRDVEERRRDVERELVRLREDEERLRHVEARIDGFDAEAYRAAAARLRTPGLSPAEIAEELARCDREAADAATALVDAGRQAETAEAEAAEARPWRRNWERIAALRRECDEAERAAAEAERRVSRAEEMCALLEDGLAALRTRSGRVRMWNRRKAADLAARLAEAGRERDALRDRATAARATAEQVRRHNERRIEEIEASVPFPLAEIERREDAARQAADRLASLQAEQMARLDRLESLRREHEATRKAAELVGECERNGWPALHAEAESLRRKVADTAPRRAELEKQYGEIQEEYDRLAKDAQSEIIKEARLVATTLARFRTTKAVLAGPYDVVLIDEAGAATLPELLLATAKADRCAVLLGDFMQLGAVIPNEIKEHRRPDVRRWLVPDVYEHCGITSAEEAMARSGCLVMDTQHRFGPQVMELANRLAYGGLLRAGAGVRPRAADDPEIVFVDTDGLHELAQVRRTGKSRGWWPAGVLLSRVLIDLHHDDHEVTGVVTPYRDQAEATLEALRDIEGGGRDPAEVGTAHRFQGREFPVVVFDMVEGRDGDGMWMAKASARPGAGRFEREGLRLFNVAVTRTQHRLYIIGSRERVEKASPRSALAHVRDLLKERRIRLFPASHLIAAPAGLPVDLGPVGSRLAEVLARHVEISTIDDERSFYETFASRIAEARSSIWLWSPWVAKRVYGILPALREAVARGVRVTVFVRDPSDTLQQKERFAEALAELREVVPNVVQVHEMHQKIVVIDERLVMLGSLNTLSQSRTREVMITVHGRHFARKLLEHEHAEVFGRPPRCERCGLNTVDLRRTEAKGWYWRCYNRACPGRNGGRAWTMVVRFDRNGDRVRSAGRAVR